MSEPTLIEIFKSNEERLKPFLSIRGRDGEFLPDDEILHRAYTYMHKNEGAEEQRFITSLVSLSDEAKKDWADYLIHFHGENIMKLWVEIGGEKILVSIMDLSVIKNMDSIGPCFEKWIQSLIGFSRGFILPLLDGQDFPVYGRAEAFKKALQERVAKINRQMPSKE